MTTVVNVHVSQGDFQPREDIVVGDVAAHQVRLEFNPNQMPEVAVMKALCAAGIRYIDEKGGDPRLTALAKTALEEGSMWAVKSITA